ncbi:hypothetical protein GCM10022221_66490 [Actinocorallia aurea]
MVARLQDEGYIERAEVAAAFGAVPRERFCPEVGPEVAYSVWDAVRTRFDVDGRCTSSLSAPWLQAAMIEAAGVAAGMRVLEVGSGGYNAALLAEIVGPRGSVVTVDIDPWVTERASRFLAETGYFDVRVLLGDAEHAADGLGPFDAVLVTVGAWDVPWLRLLAPGGRLVVPLLFKAVTRSITFVRDGDRHIGLDPTVCGFVSMQGVGAHPPREAALADGAVTLTIEDGPDLDPATLDTAVKGPRTEVWTGVTVAGDEPFDTLNLWILTEDDRFGLIHNDPARGCDLVRTAARWYCPALITPTSFAYLTSRRTEAADTSPGRWEFGVHGHGDDAAALARALHDHILIWDRDHRAGPGPAFTLHPPDAPVAPPSTGRLFPKTHTQLAMTWP